MQCLQVAPVIAVGPVNSSFAGRQLATPAWAVPRDLPPVPQFGMQDSISNAFSFVEGRRRMLGIFTNEGDERRLVLARGTLGGRRLLQDITGVGDTQKLAKVPKQRPPPRVNTPSPGECSHFSPLSHSICRYYANGLSTAVPSLVGQNLLCKVGAPSYGILRYFAVGALFHAAFIKVTSS